MSLIILEGTELTATVCRQLPAALVSAGQMQSPLIEMSFILLVNALNEEPNPRHSERCLHSAN